MNDDFSTISDILNTGVFNSKQSLQALKCSTVFSFWGQIAGRKFEKTSKPYAIKGGKMYVVCENSYVMQELLMFKKTLLTKLKVYCSPLGIDVSDFVFDYKSWNATAELPEITDFPDFYSDEKLSRVDVNENDFKQVFLDIDKSQYLNETQKQKFKDRIIKLQRAKILRKKH